MALKKKTQAVDVKTDAAATTEAAPIEQTAQPASEPAPTQESEALQETAVSEVAPIESASEEVPTTSEEVPTTSEGTELAQAQTTAVAAGPAGSNSVAAMEEEGFEGLELGYFSYPTVKLPGDGFFESSTGVKIGSHLDVVVISSKSKFLIKPANAPAKDKRVAFSYDQVTTTDGKTLAQLKSEWGCDTLDVKKYLDVPAMVRSADETTELDGTMVMLSIPPSGVQRFSGYIMEAKFMGRGAINSIVTRCKVGAKVTTTDDPFYPWMFEYVSKA